MIILLVHGRRFRRLNCLTSHSFHGGYEVSVTVLGAVDNVSEGWFLASRSSHSKRKVDSHIQCQRRDQLSSWQLPSWSILQKQN